MTLVPLWIAPNLITMARLLASIIPTPLLRGYIAYARKYVHPRLTSAAKQVLQDFYLQLRSQHGCVDTSPITTRQLQSMIRLTQARAKVELREEATAADARDVLMGRERPLSTLLLAPPKTVRLAACQRLG